MNIQYFLATLVMLFSILSHGFALEPETLADLRSPPPKVLVEPAGDQKVDQSHNWADLPPEILFLILDQLEGRAILNVAQTCKTWKQAAADPLLDVNQKLASEIGFSQDEYRKIIPYLYNTHESKINIIERNMLILRLHFLNKVNLSEVLKYLYLGENTQQSITSQQDNFKKALPNKSIKWLRAMCQLLKRKSEIFDMITDNACAQTSEAQYAFGYFNYLFKISSTEIRWYADASEIFSHYRLDLEEQRISDFVGIIKLFRQRILHKINNIKNKTQRNEEYIKQFTQHLTEFSEISRQHIPPIVSDSTRLLIYREICAKAELSGGTYQDNALEAVSSYRFSTDAQIMGKHYYGFKGTSSYFLYLMKLYPFLNPDNSGICNHHCFKSGVFKPFEDLQAFVLKNKEFLPLVDPEEAKRTPEESDTDYIKRLTRLVEEAVPPPLEDILKGG